jgi:RNA polymerase sigma-70 factor (ECF subfamily)
MDDSSGDGQTFEDFDRENRRNLERAIAARYPSDLAVESVADAMELAWPRWSRIRTTRNPVGYVYRIAERRAGRASRRRRWGFTSDIGGVVDPVDTATDVDLQAALDQLSLRQRQVVVLTQGWGLSYLETATLLGISVTSLRNHLDRGLARLRSELGSAYGAPDPDARRADEPRP